MAVSGGRGAGAGWRVFVSHTSELREFPRGGSYVAAVERAVSACGHVIVDMADFPAAGLPSAELCTERVRSCDVYVGVLGTRYGSPVQDRPELSYTELEFKTASEAGLERLVFTLDTEADVTGIPPSGLIDLEFGGRQEAFRWRVQASLVTQPFADPATLGQLVERSLRELPGRRRQGGEASLPVRLARRPAVLAGRESLLADLDARLADGAGHSGMRVAVLCGLGGVGKTSTAVEYAHRHLGEVGVCWQFGAEDPGVLAAEFAELAAQLGVRDQADGRDPVASVHSVLARAETGWLLIFDNVTDRASVERFLPPAGNGRVLITTQSQHWQPGEAVEVSVLDSQVAADFLVSRTGDANRAVSLELAEALGGLPLALEQAAAYIQATGTTTAGYLSLFRDRQAELLARGDAAGHPTDVAATLGLALLRLAGQFPNAAALLRLLAFLAPEPVAPSLLLSGGRAAGRPALEGTPEIGPLLDNQIAVGDAVAALRRYSLLSLPGSGLVLVHRLVQAVTRAQLPVGTGPRWTESAAALVEAAVPADPADPGAWPAFALLLPQVLAVLDMRSVGMGRIARYLGHSGNSRAAMDLSLLIADAHMADDASGPDHPRTLTARLDLAYWTGEAADPAAARDQVAGLLPVYERVFGPDDHSTLIARHALARWTGEAGDPAAARNQYAALLPVYETVLGTDAPGTLATRHSLAFWTGQAGNAASARDQFTTLLPAHARIQGPDHPDTLAARHNLAYWTGQAGNAASARDQFTTLLPIRERVLGPDHPVTLAARHELARWTGQAGDAASARHQFAALLRIRERVLGPDHHEALSTRRNLAYWTERTAD